MSGTNVNTYWNKHEVNWYICLNPIVVSGHPPVLFVQPLPLVCVTSIDHNMFRFVVVFTPYCNWSSKLIMIELLFKYLIFKEGAGCLCVSLKLWTSAATSGSLYCIWNDLFDRIINPLYEIPKTYIRVLPSIVLSLVDVLVNPLVDSVAHLQLTLPDHLFFWLPESFAHCFVLLNRIKQMGSLNIKRLGSWLLFLCLCSLFHFGVGGVPSGRNNTFSYLLKNCVRHCWCVAIATPLFTDRSCTASLS